MAINFLALLSFVLIVVFSTIGIYKFIHLVEELKKRSDSHCDLIMRNIADISKLQVRIEKLEQLNENEEEK